MRFDWHGCLNNNRAGIRAGIDKMHGTAGNLYSVLKRLSLGMQADRKQFGNQDADVYFFGEKIEKLSARKYRITRGGFSTCVQPTPRWEVTARSVTLCASRVMTSPS